MARKIILCLGLMVVLLSSVCLAARVSVGTSGTPGHIEFIRIYIDPYGYPAEDTELIATERDVIDKITNKKVYFSEEERIRDLYDVEELTIKGKSYWKCTPKNPKTIVVEKIKEKTYTDSSGAIVHVSDHYEDEVPNPKYLNPEELKKKVIWYEVIKTNKNNKKRESITGMC